MNAVMLNALEIEVKEETDISFILTEAYVAYALAVNLGRSIPDLRDGLKPVQRRVLLGLLELQGSNRGKFIKSARVVGEVMGKYHPHGDSSIYDAAISMTRDWGNLIPLITPQGNNGAIDGSNPAAMRYTEMKLSPAISFNTEYLDICGIKKIPNYDASGEEYPIFNMGIPNILINETRGIGVALSTYIPSFNPDELYKACTYIIERQNTEKKSTVKGIAKYIKGVDYPTGGTVASPNWLKVLEMGYGKITHTVKKDYNLKTLHIRTIPTETTTTQLINSLVKYADVLSITNVADLSDRNGVDIRVVFRKPITTIDIDRLNKLTLCSVTKTVNLVVCNGNSVKRMSVLSILETWLDFTFKLKLTHIVNSIIVLEDKLETLAHTYFIYDNIDKIVNIIQSSEDHNIAIDKLVKIFNITVDRAKYILNTSLSKMSKINITSVDLRKKTILKELKGLKVYTKDHRKIKLLILEDMNTILGVNKRICKVAPYINVDIKANTSITLYLTETSVSARVTNSKDVNKGNSYIVKGNQTVVMLTTDGILYRIPVSKIAADAVSPMAYITPRNTGIRILCIGVYKSDHKIVVKHGSKNEDIIIPNNLGIGISGIKVTSFNKKLYKAKIKKL